MEGENLPVITRDGGTAGRMLAFAAVDFSTLAACTANLAARPSTSVGVGATVGPVPLALRVADAVLGPPLLGSVCGCAQLRVGDAPNAANASASP